MHKTRLRLSQQTMAGWLFVAPSLLLLLAFLVYPAVLALMNSFTNQRLVPGPMPTRYVGLQNYQRLLADEDFWQALRNNLYFTAVVVPLQCSFALLLAMIVNQKMKMINAFRTIYFSPIATTTVVIAVIWALIFNARGLLNTFLAFISFGRIDNIAWLTDPTFAMPAIIIMSIWQSVGFQMIIFLAGLQDIPAQLYEAAKIDGANGFEQFRYVTMPQLRNTLVFVIITTTILAFRLYTQVEVMTKGGPQGATNTIVRYMVQMGYNRMRMGYASAISVIFILIVLAISLLQRRIIRSERM